MTQTRRSFLVTAAASAGAVTVLPYAAHAAAHTGNTFETESGQITVHPISHASFVMETPAGTIYTDPVGDAEQYADLPAPDLILITHEHGDHYNAETLSALMGEETHLITNPAVADMLPEDLAEGAETLANGDSTTWNEVEIDAIPAHNLTEDRMNYHPPGRDNGYVLSIDGFRTYISGDTEPVEEMLALENIDLAFLCMNLPYTQTAQQAAEAVQQFQPTYVYPYHYRGGDGGTQDPEEFAELVGDASEVRIGDWYEPDVI
ncbi:MBL fold metallo-hydrolase [Histidinibacterium aquaticum]|uniref:MBL fold metallo-hydrolase n=1 Tax=Histidinibacterium aquaticum TaxID=2613962 RepID=A0A5J5GQJ7_9RHOB|nr:MBL fold metallo-hydrolase [Histidinibacterium aquaticum]KAA9010649.1 MBL fold metallo-hydrolase [Histidinibacterium aquaticum]